MKLPVGASMRARPRVLERAPRASGLLRQASSTMMLSSVPTNSIWRKTASTKRFQIDVLLAIDIGVDGDEIIGAAHLDAVTRIIEQRGGMRSGRHQPAAELGNRPLQSGLVDVFNDHDIEADLAQTFADQHGIVLGI